MIGNHSALPPAFRFEGYLLDTARGCLLLNGGAVALRPKSFDVLRCLIENSGRLISKDELIAAVWPGLVVSDESVAKCISEVRLALGDGGQRLIKTVPRRGYLFDAPVEKIAAPSEAARHDATAWRDAPRQSDGAATHRRWRTPAAIAAALAICFALALAAAMSPTRDAIRDRASVAVLPFLNLGDPQQEYLADGLSEDLTVSLGRFSDLFVIGRNSALSFKGERAADSEIGQQLGARYLVEGSVRRDGEEIRIAARLVEAPTGRQLWADSYDRELGRAFTLQDELMREIVGRLATRVARAELDRLRTAPPRTWAAYDYYLRGNGLIESRRGEDRGAMAAEARGFFEKALAADPSYAPAVQGLAYSYAIAWLEPTRYEPFRREYQQPEIRDRALTLARQAVEIDPYLAKAHATLAWILHWHYRRDEALGEFERAIELNPNLLDGRFGLMLAHDGRAAEGVAFLKRLIRQDPFPPAIYFSYLGNAQFLAGQYEDARQTLTTGAERLPDYRPIQLWLAAAAAQSGHIDEAREAAHRALLLNPHFAIQPWLRHIGLRKESDAARLAEGVRKAGLPE